MFLTLKAPFSNHQWPSLVAQEPETRGLAHKNLPGRALPPACEPTGHGLPLPTRLCAFSQTLRACTTHSRPCHWVGFKCTLPGEALRVCCPLPAGKGPFYSAGTLRLLTSAPASVRVACLPHRGSAASGAVTVFAPRIPTTHSKVPRMRT